MHHSRHWENCDSGSATRRPVMNDLDTNHGEQENTGSRRLPKIPPKLPESSAGPGRSLPRVPDYSDESETRRPFERHGIRPFNDRSSHKFTFPQPPSPPRHSKPIAEGNGYRELEQAPPVPPHRVAYTPSQGSGHPKPSSGHADLLENSSQFFQGSVGANVYDAPEEPYPPYDSENQFDRTSSRYSVSAESSPQNQEQQIYSQFEKPLPSPGALVPPERLSHSQPKGPRKSWEPQPSPTLVSSEPENVRRSSTVHKRRQTLRHNQSAKQLSGPKLDYPLPDSQYALGRLPSDLSMRKYSLKETDLPGMFRKTLDIGRSSSTKPVRLLIMDPWSIREVIYGIAGVRVLATGNSVLSTGAIVRSLVALWMAAAPDVTQSTANSIASTLIGDLVDRGIMSDNAGSLRIVGTEEQLNDMSGVLPLFANNGCYMCGHSSNRTLTCGAFSCSNKSKRVKDVVEGSVRLDWASFWDLQARKDSGIDYQALLTPSEVRRQNVIQEIIDGETLYCSDLTLMLDLFQKGIMQTENPVIASESRRQLLDAQFFSRIPSLLSIDYDNLTLQLRKRRLAQGPIVKEIGDIYYTWLCHAEKEYVEYAKMFPFVEQSLRQESAQNPRFVKFLEVCRSDPRSRRLEFRSFLQRPTQWLQRRALLLGTILSITDEHSSDYSLLSDGIQKLKSLCSICDSVLASSEKTKELNELEMRIVFKQGQNQLVDWPHRTVLMRGDVERRSENRLEWLDIHLILLDNQLIMTKPRQEKSMIGLKYFVSRQPIPIDLLAFENGDHDPVYKSSSTRLLGTKTSSAISNGSESSSPPKHWRSTFSSTDLSSSPTKNPQDSRMDTPSASSGQMITALPSPEKTLMYSLTVVHLGHKGSSYEMFLSSPKKRDDWANCLAEAKGSRQLANMSSEHFDVIIFSSTDFQSSLGASFAQKRLIRDESDLDNLFKEAFSSGLLTPHSVLHRSLELHLASCSSDVFKTSGHHAPYAINCATTAQLSKGHGGLFVGTEAGVYFCELRDNRATNKWRRLLSLSRVTQIEFLHTFDLLLVLADQSLLSFKASSLLHIKSSAKLIGHKLSGALPVPFFQTGKVGDRTTILYKKKEGINSVLTLLEPVVSNTQSELCDAGILDVSYFRPYHKVSVPMDVYGATIFKSSICVMCSRGFEIVRLTEKRSISVPNLTSNTFSHLRSRTEGYRALGILKLEYDEFLCCYERCGVYMNAYGEATRLVYLEWVGTPQNVSIHESRYVFAFSKDLIEIWDVMSMQLVQLIHGKDIRYLQEAPNRAGFLVALNNPLYSETEIIMNIRPK